MKNSAAQLMNHPLLVGALVSIAVHAAAIAGFVEIRARIIAAFKTSQYGTPEHYDVELVSEQFPGFLANPTAAPLGAEENIPQLKRLSL